jgi:hypothetical protein
VHVLPNTAGCHSVKEAVTTAHMAREVFGTRWIKLGHRRRRYPAAGRLGLPRLRASCARKASRYFPTPPRTWSWPSDCCRRLPGAMPWGRRSAPAAD